MKTNKIEIPKDVFEKMFLQQGGERKAAHKELTGQVLNPLPENSAVEPNAEIEVHEFVKTQDGVKKALGEPHEKGGTPVKLEDGDRVLSDYLKVGGDFSKAISKEYDINVKASDTYAKALDKYLKKIGHSEATQEMEDYIAKLDKQKQTVKDDTTLALNQEVLMEEIKEYGTKLEELEPVKAKMFDLLFTAQEATKEVQPEDNVMQTGGTIQDLIIKYNIEPNKLKELLPQYNNGGELPKYQGQNGSNIFNETDPKIDKFGRNINFQNMTDAATLGKMYGEARKYTPEEKQAIKKYYETVVKDKESLKILNDRLDNNTLVYNENLLKEIQTDKDIPLQYQSETEKNLYGVQTDSRLKDYLYASDFERKFGRPYGTSPDDEALIYDEVISELEKEGVKYQGSPVTNKGIKLFGNVNAGKPKFVKEMPANKEYSLDASLYKKASPSEQESIARSLGVDKNTLDQEANKITTGFIKFTPTPSVTPATTETTTAPIETAPSVAPATTEATTAPTKTAPSVDKEEAKRRSNAGMLLLPDQSPMSLPSMLAPAKFTPRLVGYEYAQISPEQELAEIGRSQAMVKNELAQMPDAQRAATLASMDANNAQAISKVLTNTARYNAQAKERSDANRAQVQTQQSQADMASASQYQQLMGRELEAYDADLQRFYDKLTSNQVNNWKTVEMTNQFNALNPNVTRTNNGYEVINLPTFTSPEVGSNLPQPQTKKKPKGKKGGRFKK